MYSEGSENIAGDIGAPAGEFDLASEYFET
jgi:hypothetical protein